jgi:choline dehydrogenase-like flavoprotein
VGGSSAVNALIGLRGTPEDYDSWARDLGCAGWSWTDMLAAFLALEDDAELGGDGLHGRAGPIPLTRRAAEPAPLDRALRRAFADLGHPECPDAHAAGATGYGPMTLTMRAGRRVSTNDAYLEPARARPNLTIRGDTLVDRVVLDGRRAVGILTASGEEITAGEVVVSAGAIHSPAILLRSGIGPEMGLPVGANLVDHALTAGFELTLVDAARVDTVERPVVCSMLRYSSGLEAAGANDLQLLWFDVVGPTDESRATGRLLGALMHVWSRGEVRLATLDPSIDPVVELRLLSDERDRVRARRVVHDLLAVVRHPAVDEILVGVTAGPDELDALSSDDAVDAWLAANIDDYVHAAGTCRMGAAGDPAAVVDLECRVVGVERLRVCDASVMPDLPRANTHLTTVAIAERVARMMRS